MDVQNGVVEKTVVQCEEVLIDLEPSKPSIEKSDVPIEKPPLGNSNLPSNEHPLPEETTLVQDDQSQHIEEPSQPIVERIQPNPPTPTPTPTPVSVFVPVSSPAPTPAEQTPVDKKKKEEDKLSIYKALAIKLKKELVKSKDEFQKLQANKDSECQVLSEKVESLEKNLVTQSETSASTISTLEATIRNLKQQLANSEQDLFLLQENFENYKNKAQQIMQQSKISQPQCNKTIEDERMRQLRELNDDQMKQITTLEKQLIASAERTRTLELELRQFQDKLVGYQSKLDSLEAQQIKYNCIQNENDSLKIALKQFRSKLKEPSLVDTTRNCDDQSNRDKLFSDTLNDDQRSQNYCNVTVQKDLDSPKDNLNDLIEESKDGPSTIKNSSSQLDATAISNTQLSLKPHSFEITSRSSAIEDARNQIDSLTKAYLESENTNALLSDQVNILKQEIRRLQLASERIELADNLEYLKNIVLKFLSLDGSQTAQKKRLVPVLSTVLKLSPDETMLLNSTATAGDKNSLATSFFKL